MFCKLQNAQHNRFSCQTTAKPDLDVAVMLFFFLLQLKLENWEDNPDRMLLNWGGKIVTEHDQRGG